VFPLGTGFRFPVQPAIEVEGREAVTNFPPLALNEEGAAVSRSDEDFVCYRSFLLHRRTSATQWHLTVERPATSGDDVLDQVYVRDVGCAAGSELEGLFALYAGESLLLASHDASAACPDGDVVVLAVKPGAERAGESRAHLVYSMMTPTYETTP
jgi:hypothetical protein